MARRSKTVAPVWLVAEAIAFLRREHPAVLRCISNLYHATKYKTIEDWTRGATVFAGICVLFFGNWLALRGKKAVSAARSARAMEELLKMDEKKKE